MSDVTNYVQRALNSAWQTFISSLAVAPMINAIVGGQIGVVGTLLLAALGAAVGALVTFVKNFAFKPTATGAVGLLELVMSTFIEGCCSALSVELVSSLFTNYTPGGLRSVGLAALGGGIAGLLSLIKNSATGLPTYPGASRKPFVFVGSDGTAVAAAAGLSEFLLLAPVVSDSIWNRHLLAGDFSNWIRTSLNDEALADSVHGIETSGGTAPDTRARIIQLIRTRYPG